MTGLKASIKKYFELSWADLRDLKAFLKRSASFNGFSPENFSNPSLRIASVANERGETVCMTPIENCFVISGYGVSPSSSPDEAASAGDLIDSEIERLGARSGVSKLLIILPGNTRNVPSEFRQVFIHERLIPAAVTTHGIGLSAPSQAKYLN